MAMSMPYAPMVYGGGASPTAYGGAPLPPAFPLYGVGSVPSCSECGCNRWLPIALDSHQGSVLFRCTGGNPMHMCAATMVVATWNPVSSGQGTHDKMSLAHAQSNPEELDRSQEELDRSQEEFDRSQEELVRLQEELVRARLEAKQAQAEATHARADLAHTQSHLAQTQSKLARTQKQIVLLEDALEKTTTSLESSQNEQTQLNTELSERSRKLQKLQNEHVQLADAHNRLTDTHATLVAETQAREMRRKREQLAARKKLSAATQKLATFEKECKQLRKALGETQALLNIHTGRASQVEAEHNEQIQELRDKVFVLEATRDVLEMKVQGFGKQNRSAIDLNRALIARLQQATETIASKEKRIEELSLHRLGFMRRMVCDNIIYFINAFLWQNNDWHGDAWTLRGRQLQNDFLVAFFGSFIDTVENLVRQSTPVAENEDEFDDFMTLVFEEDPDMPRGRNWRQRDRGIPRGFHTLANALFLSQLRAWPDTSNQRKVFDFPLQRVLEKTRSFMESCLATYKARMQLPASLERVGEIFTSAPRQVASRISLTAHVAK